MSKCSEPAYGIFVETASHTTRLVVTNETSEIRIGQEGRKEVTRQRQRADRFLIVVTVNEHLAYERIA